MKDCKSCIYFKKPMYCEFVAGEMKHLKRCSCWIDKDGNEF